MLPRIRAGDAPAADELRCLLAPGVRFMIARRLGADAAADSTREVLDAVLKLIRSGRIVDGPAILKQVRRLVNRFPPCVGLAEGPVIQREAARPHLRA